MSTTVLQAPDVERALTRISYEIIESNAGTENLVLLGIPSRGVPLAQAIGERIQQATNSSFDVATMVGALDITMYRDDIAHRPLRASSPTVLPPAGIDGKTVVLVDDVLFRGRTVRAALDALADVGRPATVRLAVLVDRGHRQFPIRADFVGKNIPTSTKERVTVHVAPVDETTEVIIEP